MMNTPTERRGLLLGLGLTFSTATQFRGPGGIGPGEALLGTWCLLAVLALVRGRSLRISVAATHFAVFWLVGLTALAAGWLIGMMRGVSAPEGIRDFLAFLLSATVFGLLLVRPGAEAEARRAAFTYTIGTVIGLSVLLLGSFLSGGKLGSIEVWYFGLRFQGWATNPNQTALAVLPIPFLAFFLAAGRGWVIRLLLTLSAAGAVALGIITQSDALIVAWILSLGVAVVFGWIVRVIRPVRGFWNNVWLKVVLPAVVLVGFVVAVPMFAHPVAEVASARFSAAGQSEGRIARWRNGLISATTSPVIGLGPGPFSGPRSAFGHEEAHNTLVDWTASTGLVGFIALLLLLAAAVTATIRRSSAALLGMVLALVFFMAFHYVMRQPAFWFVLLLPQLLPGRSGAWPGNIRRTPGEAAFAT